MRNSKPRAAAASPLSNVIPLFPIRGRRVPGAVPPAISRAEFDKVLEEVEYSESNTLDALACEAGYLALLAVVAGGATDGHTRSLLMAAINQKAEAVQRLAGASARLGAGPPG